LVVSIGCAGSSHPVPPNPPAETSGGADGAAGHGATGGAGGGAPDAPTIMAPDAGHLEEPGASDAGPSDAPAAGDATAPGGPSPPCRFALCEGFETYQDGDLPDPALWAQKTTKATVDSVRAARGTKALHIPPLIHDSVYIRETRTFPALGKAFYGRVFLWVEKQPLEKPANLYHWTMIESSEMPDDSGKQVRLGGHIEASLPGNWLRFNYETHAPAMPHETGLSDKTAIVAPRIWNCIEFYFNMDTQEARIWLNGTERPMLHWLNSMPGKPLFHFPTEIKSLSFGWTEYQPPQTPWEVWLDEIAVDSQRIGCDN
jgi:hypothetical protein